MTPPPATRVPDVIDRLVTLLRIHEELPEGRVRVLDGPQINNDTVPLVFTVCFQPARDQDTLVDPQVDGLRPSINESWDVGVLINAYSGDGHPKVARDLAVFGFNVLSQIVTTKDMKLDGVCQLARLGPWSMVQKPSLVGGGVECAINASVIGRSLL